MATTCSWPGHGAKITPLAKAALTARIANRATNIATNRRICFIYHRGPSLSRASLSRSRASSTTPIAAGISMRPCAWRSSACERRPESRLYPIPTDCGHGHDLCERRNRNASSGTERLRKARERRLYRKTRQWRDCVDRSATFSTLIIRSIKSRCWIDPRASNRELGIDAGCRQFPACP